VFEFYESYQIQKKLLTEWTGTEEESYLLFNFMGQKLLQHVMQLLNQSISKNQLNQFLEQVLKAN
jgi:hypothetical protein